MAQLLALGMSRSKPYLVIMKLETSFFKALVITRDEETSGQPCQLCPTPCLPPSPLPNQPYLTVNQALTAHPGEQRFIGHAQCPPFHLLY